MSDVQPVSRFRKWRLLAVILFGLVLHVPTLNMGFFADDYTHQLVLQGLVDHPTMRAWNLYDWGETPRPGDSTYESGAFPWWSSNDWKGRFFRPLTSMTLWLDHVMFGEWALGYHLTSLVWYAVLLMLLHMLYKSLGLAETPALVALLIFAAMDSSLLPVGWPANRNSLVETVFLVAAILILSRLSGSGRWLALTLAVFLGVLACLSKESGVAAFVLIVVYLHGQRRSTAARASVRWVWTGTLACAALALAHLTFFVSAGFGTNTTFYPMPWQHPLAYAERLFTLGAIAPMSFIGMFPTDFLSLQPQYALPAALLCLVPGAVLCRTIWNQVKGFPSTWFWIAWIVLTLLPQGSPPTSDRLLFQASIGAAALLGLFLTTVWKRPAIEPIARRRKVFSAFIALGVFVVSPISLLFAGSVVHYLAVRSLESLRAADLGDPTLGRRDIFLLQAPDDLVTALAPAVWAVDRGEVKVRSWPMQLGGRPLRWTRIDERTYDLETIGEPFLTRVMENVFLTSNDVPAVARTWQTALFTVEAMDSGPAGFTRFRVRCPAALEDHRYRFLWVDGSGKLARISPPSVGESQDIPEVPPPFPIP